MTALPCASLPCPFLFRFVFPAVAVLIASGRVAPSKWETAKNEDYETAFSISCSADQRVESRYPVDPTMLLPLPLVQTPRASPMEVQQQRGLQSSLMGMAAQPSRLAQTLLNGGMGMPGAMSTFGELAAALVSAGFPLDSLEDSDSAGAVADTAAASAAAAAAAVPMPSIPDTPVKAAAAAKARSGSNRRTANGKQKSGSRGNGKPREAASAVAERAGEEAAIDAGVEYRGQNWSLRRGDHPPPGSPAFNAWIADKLKREKRRIVRGASGSDPRKYSRRMRIWNVGGNHYVRLVQYTCRSCGLVFERPQVRDGAFSRGHRCFSVHVYLLFLFSLGLFALFRAWAATAPSNVHMKNTWKMTMSCLQAPRKLICA